MYCIVVTEDKSQLITMESSNQESVESKWNHLKAHLEFMAAAYNRVRMEKIFLVCRFEKLEFEYRSLEKRYNSLLVAVFVVLGTLWLTCFGILIYIYLV